MKSKRTFPPLVKDHSISGKLFELSLVNEHGLLKTKNLPQDLSKFYQSEDYISHTDSKRSLFEKAYHFIRSIALRQKLKLINGFGFETKTLLDFGCGTGDFIQTVQHDNWSVSGIEPNHHARNIAKRKVGESVFDPEQLKAFSPCSFQIISLWHVLEHLVDLDFHIKEFDRLLSATGRLIIAVPNYRSYDAQYYETYWAAYDVPRHIWHFSQESLIQLMSKKGFQLERKKPMRFDAYYVSLLSEKYKSGRMNLIKAFWIGFKSNLKANRTGEYSSIIYIFKKS